MNLKTIFPHGSNAFFNQNSHLGSSVQSAEPQQTHLPPLASVPQRKEKSLPRTTLRYRGFFVQLKDPENLAGSTKALTDALVRSGLIDGDSPDKISITWEQEKVSHYADERIELTITN